MVESPTPPGRRPLLRRALGVAGPALLGGFVGTVASVPCAALARRCVADFYVGEGVGIFAGLVAPVGVGALALFARSRRAAAELLWSRAYLGLVGALLAWSLGVGVPLHWGGLMAVGKDLATLATGLVFVFLATRWSPPYLAPRSPCLPRELLRAALLALLPALLSCWAIRRATYGLWNGLFWHHWSPPRQVPGLLVPLPVAATGSICGAWVVVFLLLRLRRPLLEEPLRG
ncbi:MAG: hypothetical protein AB7N76_31020 [Planctomycetota bacterium]